MKICVVGAGFSGAVLAWELANSGYKVVVYESRSHIGGNCYTERDEETGIMKHKYGPHIFHTDDKEVWDYIEQFTTFKPYVNRVKTTLNGRVYSLPINLHTINQFYDASMSPCEAKVFVEKLADKNIDAPDTFEEQALKFVGEDLYQAFFKGYTEKQWGVHPSCLPASILKRLPLRFNYDDNYFSHKFQGIPEHGYTFIFEKMLSHKNIELCLNTMFEKCEMSQYDHVFYSGPIDCWFGKRFGPLGYRTLDFQQEIYDGDYQGCAVMNYGEVSVPYTRITEHKHFAPWETHDKTVIYKEFSRECKDEDTPYYPIRLENEKLILQKYIDAAYSEDKVSFLGRLGTYRYLDMDVTIREALDAAAKIKSCVASGVKIPPFFTSPL